MKKKITALGLVCMFTTCVISANELSQREKSAYSGDKTFEEICFSPEDASSKPISKHKFQIAYQGQTLKVPKAFQKLVIGEYIIVKATGRDSENILLIYKKNNQYLYSKFKVILPDSTVTIYGTLRHKTVKKVDYYFMIIDDVETVAPKSVTSDESENQAIPFVEQDYEKVSFRDFKVNFIKYLDKKVYLSLHLKSIINQINGQLQKLAGMDVENYFIINAVKVSKFDVMEPEGPDVQPFGLNIVVSRGDKNITEEIIKTSSGADMLFYGRLKKLEDPTNSRIRPSYFFMLDGIKGSEQVKAEEKVEKEEEIQPSAGATQDDYSETPPDSISDAAP